jgi:hypothetical protein
MLAVALGGMKGELRWWCCEDQPSVSRIDGWKAEHIAKERAVGGGIAAVDDRTHPKDHGPP